MVLLLLKIVVMLSGNVAIPKMKPFSWLPILRERGEVCCAGAKASFVSRGEEKETTGLLDLNLFNIEKFGGVDFLNKHTPSWCFKSV